jgi:hypothetical protein
VIVKPKITPSQQGANMKIILTQEQLEKIIKEYFYDDYNIKINEIVFAANVEQFCTIYTKEAP